jgi:hypothetical protein
MKNQATYTALVTALLVTALLGTASAGSGGEPDCSGTHEYLLSWPDTDPVWQMCWVDPDYSSADAGSGLELRDVYYQGILVFKRAHVPMLNVDYDDGTCFRDWLNSSEAYRTDNLVATGYYEPPWPAETVCDHAIEPLVPPGDCPWGGPGPCANGVSAEYASDHFLLTWQGRAGWYRYTMRWTFWEDGTIEPTFGFGTYSDAFSHSTHRHHAYWRFDFDIDGADGDTASQIGGSLPGDIAQETDRTWEDGSVMWEVHDGTSGRGYRVTPGSQDVLLPIDSYSKTDFMVSLYHSTELDDQGGGCDINVDSIVDGEAVQDTDVVLWYRGGVQDVVAVDIFQCKVAGPILTPLGEWSDSTDFSDGFESGDTTGWSSTVP